MGLLHWPLWSLAIGHVLSAPTEGGSPLSHPTIDLGYAVVRGSQYSMPSSATLVNKFLGIPYAEQPKRFAAGEKARSREAVVDATDFGPSCLQSLGVPEGGPDPEMLGVVFNNPPPPESEDCLTVNVFSPAGEIQDGELKPVLLFIHGGGFQMGSSRVANLEGFVAYEGLVAVSINYRTNVFGFPSSPELTPQDRNLAFSDQRLAIQWVQDHISKFGGDASKVTLWGQSAGAMSVDTHLQSFATSDSLPFRGAIMSSGQMSFGILGLREPTESSWTQLASMAGCDDTESVLECMRLVPVKTITDSMAEKNIVFGPNNDEHVVFSNAADRWRYGAVSKVPILTGTVADEGRALMDQNIDLDTFLDANFPIDVVSNRSRQLILSAYLGNRETTDFDVEAAIYNDFVWLCPQGILAGWSSGNSMPTWRYYFNSTAVGLLPPELSWLRKFHGSDLFLLFSDPSDAGLTPQTSDLIKYLRQAISNFVKDPVAGPGWPALGSDSAPYDLVVLGDIGSYETGGAMPVRRGLVDDVCVLYSPLYPLLSTYAKRNMRITPMRGA